MSGPAEDSSYGRELADAQRFAVKDARIRQLEAALAAMTKERDHFSEVAIQKAADLASAREEPEIHVRWDKDGWTNTHPVRLVAETDGYIDWPVTLKVARYQPEEAT